MSTISEKITIFELGHGLVILQDKVGQLHVLNPLARWIWESSASGMEPEKIKTMLSEQTGHDGQAVEVLSASWREAGIVPSLAETSRKRRPYHHTYWLGGGRIRVQSNDKVLLKQFHSCLAHLEDDRSGPIAGKISIYRAEDGFSLYKNNTKIHLFSNVNDLIVQGIWEVIEIACRAPESLMTVHGGAVAKDEICCILAGVGGSGKTTLTAGLVASGFTLVADDVIPIDARSGLLDTVPMSMCIKEGSWPVLEDFYTEANKLPIYNRFGKTVRFYPPPLSAVPSPSIRYRVNAVLFPCYVPDSNPQIMPIEPYDILAKLLKSNSIINQWTPEKLEGVLSWVSGLTGYRLTYPNLVSGMNLVDHVFRNLSRLGTSATKT